MKEWFDVCIHKSIKIKESTSSTLVTSVKIYAENVNVNDLIYTLMNFDRSVRAKHKEEELWKQR